MLHLIFLFTVVTFPPHSTSLPLKLRDRFHLAALKLGRIAEKSQQKLERVNEAFLGIQQSNYAKQNKNRYVNIKNGEEIANSSDHSETETYSDPLNPKQIRLAYLKDGMTVSWTTRNNFGEDPLIVRYSLEKNALFTYLDNLDEDNDNDDDADSNDATDNKIQLAIGGTSTTYGTAWFHNVPLRNLKPNTVYYYSVPHSSEIYSFKTAFAPGENLELTILVNGDCGLDDGRDTIASMLANIENVDFYWHIGDISYADDWYLRPGEEYERIWNKWMHLMTPVTSQKAYMTLPGNHEVTCSEAIPFSCPSHQRNFTAYRHRFSMPSKDSNGEGNMWYSFDNGLAHFISINTETSFKDSPSGPGTWLGGGDFGDQISWLKGDLEKATQNREIVPWIIVAGHRPFYTSRPKAACSSCRAAFEQLFIDYGVDLYLSGHVHWMERLAVVSPGGKVESTNYLNPKYPVYLINGAGGNVEGHPDRQTHEAYTKFLNHAEYGYSLLKIFNSTHATYEFIGAETKQVLDKIVIVKDRNQNDEETKFIN